MKNVVNDVSKETALPGLWSVFAETVFRCKNPFILYLASMILTGPAALFIWWVTAGSSRYYTWSFPGVSIIGCLIFCGAACVIPMVILGYLDNKQALDVYHSLPVTRKKQFAGNFAAGLALLLVPYVLTIIPVGLLCDLSSFWTKGDINYSDSFGITWASGNVQNLITVMLIGILLYVIMSFMMYSCSTIVESTAYFLIVLVGYFGLCLILNDVISSVTFGYAEFSFFKVLYRFSPFYVFDALLSNSTELLTYDLQLIVPILIISVLTFQRAMKRKSEQAGGYIYPPLYICAAGGGSIVVGLFFYSILDKDTFVEKLIVFLFSAAIASIIYIALDSIRQRSFRYILRSLSGCTCGVVIVLLVSGLVNLTGTFGYEDHIPDVDEIASVQVNSSELELYDNFAVSDEKNIECVLQFHKTIIDNKEIFKYNSDKEVTEYDAYEFDNGTLDINSYGRAYVTITYTLKNGKTLSRNYSNIPFALTKPLYELAGSTEYSKSIAESIRSLSAQMDDYNYDYGEKYLSINVEEVLPASTGGTSYLTLSDDQISEFLEALACDWENRPEGWFNNPDENPICKISFYDYIFSNNELEFNIYSIDTNILTKLEEYGFYNSETGKMDIGTVNDEQEYYFDKIGVVKRNSSEDYAALESMNIFYFSNKTFYDEAGGNQSVYLSNETLRELSSYLILVGNTEEASDVLIMDGTTYLVREGKTDEVKKILSNNDVQDENNSTDEEEIADS